jgi:glycosyltransferase involved in cell wall biosynthesis
MNFNPEEHSVTLYTVLPIVGGSATIVLGLADYYLSEGIKVNILVRRQPEFDHNDELALRLQEKGANVVVIGSTKEKNYFGAIEALFAVWRMHRGILISIGMGKVPALLARFGGFRKSFFYYINHDPQVSAVRNLGRSVRNFDAVIAISPASLEPLSKLVPVPRDIIWIPQFSEMSAPGVQQRERIFGSPLSFGFIGALKRSKGINLLIDIWKQNPNLGTLQVYGEGPERAVVEAAAANDLRIRYGGHFTPEERDRALPEFFASIDYLLVPSLGHGEGIPTVILEALCCGCPVIASSGGGTRAFADVPLASAFEGIVDIISEEAWEKRLSEIGVAPPPAETLRQTARERYHAWFANSVLEPKWRALLD